MSIPAGSSSSGPSRRSSSTGMIAMKGTHRVDNDCGDGVAMAFRAGGRLVDMEFTFGGTFNVLMKKFDFPSYNVAVAHGARLINARGERFMQQYDPQRLERSELSHVVAAFAKEIVDGRGPVYRRSAACRRVLLDRYRQAAPRRLDPAVRSCSRSQDEPAADRADLGPVGERPQRAADRPRRPHQSAWPARRGLGRQERRDRNPCQRRLADRILQGIGLACRRDGGHGEPRKPASGPIAAGRAENAAGAGARAAARARRQRKSSDDSARRLSRAWKPASSTA